MQQAPSANKVRVGGRQTNVGLVINGRFNLEECSEVQLVWSTGESNCWQDATT